MMKNQELITECPNCNAYVGCDIHGEYEYYKKRGGSGKYLFVICKNCETPLVLDQNNVGNLVEGDIWSNPKLLYPKNSKYFNPDVPISITTAISEAQECFKIKAFTASVIISRKILDGICDLEGIKSSNLNDSLKKLRDKGIIDSRLYEWADQLRLSGNEAAHDIKIEFSEEDTKDILDFTIAILDYIYSFKNKFETFKSRRGLNKK